LPFKDALVVFGMHRLAEAEAITFFELGCLYDTKQQVRITADLCLPSSSSSTDY
jgi:hypothetical protein